LSGYKTALGDYLSNNPNMPLADIAYSLHMTRDNFSQRSFILSESSSHASQDLLEDNSKVIKNNVLKLIPSELAFLYTGQGSQYIDMGKALYNNEKVYKEAIDVCAELLMEDLQLDIREVIFPDTNLKESAEKRSEEHTSELQSRENLVCRLLLEKKKKIKH